MGSAVAGLLSFSRPLVVPEPLPDHQGPGLFLSITDPTLMTLLRGASSGTYGGVS